MVWVVKLEEVIEGKVVSRRKVTALNRPEHINDLDDLGLRLEDGKALLAELQALVVERQFEHDQGKRSTCTHCGTRQRLKDYRPRKFDTVLESVTNPGVSPWASMAIGTQNLEFEKQSRTVSGGRASTMKHHLHVSRRIFVRGAKCRPVFAPRDPRVCDALAWLESITNPGVHLQHVGAIGANSLAFQGSWIMATGGRT